MDSSPAIGIDLGTTYCCVAVYKDGEVIIIPNHLDKNTTPSYVAYLDDDITVGDTAKNQAHENPENTIFDVKRIIGRSLQDPLIQRDRKLWPFELTEVDGRLRVKADGRTLLPEEISTEILIYLKQTADDFIGSAITEAVITVPAYFTDYQRFLTKQAAIQAGIKPLQLITEPTAASIAYNLHRRDKTSQNCLIFDLGGGTFDVAVLSIEQNFIHVRAIGGDARLGGEDFDNAMVDYCIEEFQKLHGVDLAAGKDSENPAVKFKVSKRLRRIKKECERQKCYLSQARTVTVSLHAVNGELDLDVEFTRTIFEALIQDRLDKCVEIVENVLQDSGIAKEDIDDVVLVGGSSRIPKMQDLLSAYFGGKTLYRAINPDEAVASGAAIQAYFAQNRDLAGIGIEEPDFVVPIPTTQTASTPNNSGDSASDSTSVADTPDPSSPWSSGVSMRPTLPERSMSESPTPGNRTQRPSAFVTQASFPTLKTSSLTSHIGFYMDEYIVRVFDLTDGKLTVSSKPILEVQPYVAIKDAKLYVGADALKYEKSDSFYRVMELLTKSNNKICQMADAGRKDYGILFEEEIIAAFLQKIKQRVERVMRSSVLQVVLTVPFIPTSSQRGRLQVATVLAGFVKTTVYSNLILTTVSYADLRTSLKMKANFDAIRFLVVHYGRRFFSAAVIDYSPTMARVRSYNSSYLLSEEDRLEFISKHEASYAGDRDVDKIAQYIEPYVPILKNVCEGVEKKSIDFGFLIRNQESELIDNFVTEFFDKTVYTFNDLRGPVSGAGILATQSFKLGSIPILDSMPGNLQCTLLRDRRLNMIYNEPNEGILVKPGIVFSYDLVLDREKSLAITLQEMVLDKPSEICAYRVSAKYINEPRPVQISLICELDFDGVYHLFVDYAKDDPQYENVSIDFFRTDKLNSEISNISIRVENFNKFYKAVSKSRIGLSGWWS